MGVDGSANTDNEEDVLGGEVATDVEAGKKLIDCVEKVVSRVMVVDVVGLDDEEDNAGKVGDTEIGAEVEVEV